MSKSDQLVPYLIKQSIIVEPIAPNPSFYDPKNELHATKVPELSFAVQSDSRVDLSDTLAEAMSLASMYAIKCLEAIKGDKVLDVCAAPGMKGMYLNGLVDVEYYANDLSADRLSRMRRLFDKHGVEPVNITKYDGRYIDRAYEEDFFDRIIIDAPCSGEGVALGGDNKTLDAWSPAKVKRLQQLQIKILKSAWKLLKPNGRMVYATCTLNRNENERVIKKALGITLEVIESPLDTNNLHMLKNGHALRILPSTNSIGFFVAVLDKQPEA